MGYMCHHAILVTSWSAEKIDAAHDAARRIVPGLVTPILEGRINGERTFVIVPDGSKEGWDDSNLADTQREAYIAWLRAHVDEEGDSAYRWVEVQYGDDNLETAVLDSSDDDRLAYLEAHKGEAESAAV